jgi:hypothetical protein
MIGDYHGRMSSPSTSAPAIQLPTGGRLLGFANPHSPSNECSGITNLQTQVAPLIVSMSCQLKVLKLLKPLIDIIHGLPAPPVKALEEFSKAAIELVPCLLIPTPSGLLSFVHDLLCMEIKSLDCLLESLQSAVGQPGAELSASSITLVRSILDSYQPIVGTLNLAAEFFATAGFALPEAPVLGNGTDLASVSADQSAILAFKSGLQSVADVMGGCS